MIRRKNRASLYETPIAAKTMVNWSPAGQAGLAHDLRARGVMRQTRRKRSAAS